jgi:hypothetical protein
MIIIKHININNPHPVHAITFCAGEGKIKGLLVSDTQR